MVDPGAGPAGPGGPDNAAPEDLWERHAGWWQDGFTDGADPEYVDQIVPLTVDLLGGRHRVLDVGTGEGQLARMLARQGCEVIGVDPTVAQLATAVDRRGGPAYLRARADALPFADAAFDGVLACLVFEHIDEMDAAIDDVGRVLAPGGRFVLMLNHPIVQAPGSDWVEDHTVEPVERYWRLGPYLVESHTVETVDMGVQIPFVHRPLGRYLNAVVDAGLTVERLLEPPPPDSWVDRAPEARRMLRAYPRLAVVVATRQRS